MSKKLEQNLCQLGLGETHRHDHHWDSPSDNRLEKDTEEKMKKPMITAHAPKRIRRKFTNMESLYRCFLASNSAIVPVGGYQQRVNEYHNSTAPFRACIIQSRNPLRVNARGITNNNTTIAAADSSSRYTRPMAYMTVKFGEIHRRSRKGTHLRKRSEGRPKCNSASWFHQETFEPHSSREKQ